MSVKLKEITATINLGNYSDIRPTVETDDAKAGLKYLSDLARSVGNSDYADKLATKASQEKSGNIAQSYKVVRAMNGVEVMFDEANHKYVDKDGNPYLSGSKFSSDVERDFDMNAVAEKVAKDGLTAQTVLKIWNAKNKVACDFGSALHEALDMYQKYHIYSAILGGEDKILPNSPYLKDCVRSAFTEERKKENALSEVFVADPSMKMCGFIDRLVFVEKDTKAVIVQDWKTNDLDKRVTFIPEIRSAYTDIEKNKLGAYKFQLSFYARILKSMGYFVKECQIINLNDTQWEVTSFKPLNIDKALEIVRK